MRSSFGLLVLLTSNAASSRVLEMSKYGISPTSEVGSKILSKSRRLDTGADYSWMKGFSIKYESCFRSQDDEDLVIFSLCPRGGDCKRHCENGATYLTDMNFFIDCFTEAQMKAHEYACEMARETCGDDDGCFNAKGLEKCDDEEERSDYYFNVQEFLGCAPFDQYGYVGPYCASDGESIYLGYFTDSSCTNHVGQGSFYEMHGYNLDYSSKSLVSKECAKCKEHGTHHQYYSDYVDEDNVLEQCEALYYSSAGCEMNFYSFVSNPDTDGCDLIQENGGFTSMQGDDWWGNTGVVDDDDIIIVGGNDDDAVVVTINSSRLTWSDFLQSTDVGVLALLLAVGLFVCCTITLYKSSKVFPPPLEEEEEYVLA